MSSPNKNQSAVEVLQTSSFARKIKKLRRNEIDDLDKAIKAIINNPEIGIQKRGDLSDIWIYKFKMLKQENLLAYQWDEQRRILITLGVHENFYRDLKKNRIF